MSAKYPVGTAKVPPAKASRLLAYVRALGWAVVAASLVFGVLAMVQIFFHPFDFVLEKADASLAAMDAALVSDQVAGVSVGTVVLVGLVASLPLFKKGVRRKQYALSFWRGLLSSAIFLATDKLYRYVQGLGVLYFSATLAVFVAATIVLVELISRMSRVEYEAETRTELIASIVSGLVFGLIVQLGEYGLGLLRRIAG
jgi:hypothetical protein